MFGFGSSSSSSKSDTPVPPTREQRQQCWNGRDAYFACLDQNNILQPGDGEMGDTKGVCAEFRKAYESSCGKSWIDYFNKRRILEIRSAKTLESASAQHAAAQK